MNKEKDNLFYVVEYSPNKQNVQDIPTIHIGDLYFKISQRKNQQ